VGLTPYSLKKATTFPQRSYRRWRYRSADPLAKAMLEAFSYRRAMLEFMGAVAVDPDLLHRAEIDADATVLDVGAYVGEWSEPVAQRYDPTIYAFEPGSPSRRRFEQTLAGFEKVQLFDYGLGGRDQVVDLSLAGPGSNVFDLAGTFGTEPVQIRDVASVLDELGLDHVDLLKVNIEGGEYDLFDRLIETDWLPRIRLVSVQFHDWIPGAARRRRSIRRELARTHEEAWNYPWVWEFWSQPAAGYGRGP
jgi:FkbM family methyltransferase